ncbi:hypothetical protein KR026_000516, partial [Drosophila bipectinata]
RAKNTFPGIMNCLLVVLLALVPSWAAGASSDSPENIITNGNPAYDGQAPYVVGMAFQSSNIWCSGTIIGDTWILTSPACLTGSTGVTIFFGATRLSQAQFTVTVGTGAYITGNKHLALVKVPRVGFSNRVNRVNLPSMRDRSSYDNRWASVCGWGVTSLSNSQPDWLQCVDQQIMPNSECAAFFGTSTVNDQVLCTRTPNGRSPCFGDAGSPLVTQQGSIVVGISEFVAANGCTLGIPAGFARITSQLEWIRRYTGIAN